MLEAEAEWGYADAACEPEGYSEWVALFGEPLGVLLPCGPVAEDAAAPVVGTSRAKSSTLALYCCAPSLRRAPSGGFTEPTSSPPASGWYVVSDLCGSMTL